MAEWNAFSECIRYGGPEPIPVEQIFASTLATIRIADSLQTGRKLTVSLDDRNQFAAPLVS